MEPEGSPAKLTGFFDIGTAPRRSRGEGEGEARGERIITGRFSVSRAERRRDRPREAGAKTPRLSTKTRFYFIISSHDLRTIYMSTMYYIPGAGRVVADLTPACSGTIYMYTLVYSLPGMNYI